jgi:hypothetical protein
MSQEKQRPKQRVSRIKMALAPAVLFFCAFVISGPKALGRDRADYFKLSGADAEKINVSGKVDADFPTLSQSTVEVIDALKIRRQLLELKETNLPDLEMHKQKIINQMLILSMEVQAALSEIDGEIARSTGYQNALEQRRYKSVRNSTIATFVASGILQMIGSSLMIPSAASPVTGNVLSLNGAGVATTFPLYQLHQEKDQKADVAGNPTMLVVVSIALATLAQYYPRL